MIMSKLNGVIFLLVFIFLGTVSMSFSEVGSKFQITHYEFGEITINGEKYSKDIVLWPNGEIKPGPEDMHSLSISDFDDFFTSGHKKILIGTGDEGKVSMDFRSKLKKEFKNRGIELKLINTHEAVKIINDNKDNDLVAFIHLNC